MNECWSDILYKFCWDINRPWSLFTFQHSHCVLNFSEHWRWFLIIWTARVDNGPLFTGFPHTILLLDLSRWYWFYHSCWFDPNERCVTLLMLLCCRPTSGFFPQTGRIHKSVNTISLARSFVPAYHSLTFSLQPVVPYLVFLLSLLSCPSHKVLPIGAHAVVLSDDGDVFRGATLMK